MAWLKNKYGGWFEIPDEDVKSDYISKGTLYTNQNGARIKVLNADGKSVTYRITSDKDISLDTVSSKSEDKTVTKEGFQKMLSANGYKSQSQKEKQIEANKKEADRKNAEEKQKNEDQRINKAEKNMQKEIKENGLADRYKKYTDEMHKLEKEKQPVPDRLRNELSKIDKEVAKLEEKHDIPIRLGYDGKIDVNRDLIRNTKEEDDDWRNYSGKNRK